MHHILYRGAVYREAQALPQFLYHVTHALKLDYIYDEGLLTGGSQNFPGYAGHARGRLFLCTFEAVDCWVHKLHYTGLGESDNVVEDGWFPIVLRVETDLVADLLSIDKLGDEACRSGQNYYITEGIDSSDLEYWDGANWSTFEGGDREYIIDQAQQKATREEEDDGEAWYELDEKAFMPSHP